MSNLQPEANGNGNGARISNREIFDELRAVHNKLDVHVENFKAHTVDDADNFAQIDKRAADLEIRAIESEKKLAYYGGAVAIGTSIITLVMASVLKIFVH